MTSFRALKSMPPVARPIGGMSTSETIELTIFPNAAPMMTPIAMSTTLPRCTNALNSATIPIAFPSARRLRARRLRPDPDEPRSRLHVRADRQIREDELDLPGHAGEQREEEPPVASEQQPAPAPFALHRPRPLELRAVLLL